MTHASVSSRPTTKMNPPPKLKPSSGALSSDISVESSSIKKGLIPYEELLEILNVKFLSPEENDNFFQDIIGLKEPLRQLQQVIKFWKHPEISLQKNIKIPHNFIFIGPTGVGKAKIAYAFAKETELPIIVIDSERFLSESPIKLMRNFEQILKKNSSAVILLKNLVYFSSIGQDKLAPVFSKFCSYFKAYPNCFFFATLSSGATELPALILSDDGFDAVLAFEEPDLEQREKFIHNYLEDYQAKLQLKKENDTDSLESNIQVSLSSDEINKIAKNTLGMTCGNLIHLFHTAFLQADLEQKTALDFASVDIALSKYFYGSQKKKMTEQERSLAAYHEAGHVIAGYFGNPNYKLSKVEIIHREKSLGLTINEIDEEKFLYTKEDWEREIILSFGGKAAEQIIFQTTTSGVSEDLAIATVIAANMIKVYGMFDRLGPISLDDDVFISDALNDLADDILQNYLKEVYQKTEKLLLEHKAELIALAEELKEKETLYSQEILSIFEKTKKVSQK